MNAKLLRIGGVVAIATIVVAATVGWAWGPGGHGEGQGSLITVAAAELDMAVEDLPSGKPLMVLTGGAQKRLDTLTPPGMKAQVDVTLSDEYPMAQAMVVISAVPAATEQAP